MDCKGTQKIWKHNIYEIFFMLFRAFFRRYQFFILMRFSKLFVLFMAEKIKHCLSAFYHLWEYHRLKFFDFCQNCYFCQKQFLPKGAENSELADRSQKLLSIFAERKMQPRKSQKEGQNRTKNGANRTQKHPLLRGIFKRDRSVRKLPRIAPPLIAFNSP